MKRNHSVQSLTCTIVATWWLFASAAVLANEASIPAARYLRPNDNQQPRLPRLPLSTKIVNGQQVTQEDLYPWFVAPADASATALCGGSLIWPDIVLTAAHCDMAFAVDSYVNVGAVHLWDQGNATRRQIHQVLPHTSYDGERLINDFMLLQLDEPVDNPLIAWNDQPNVPFPGDSVRTMGFGNNAENGNITAELHHVNLTVSALLTCSNTYGQLYQPDVMLCAGAPSGNPAGACLGDSGGALLNEDNVLVGLVSFGLGCAQPGVPGMYARVSGVASWIQRHICTLSSAPPEDCLPEWLNEAIPTQSPTPTSVNPFEDDAQQDPDHEVNLTLVIQYDDRPEETTWEISRNGVTLVEGPGETPNPLEKVEYEFHNVPFGSYVFTIRDAIGDGVNVNDTKGTFAFYLEINAVEEDNKSMSRVLIAGGDLDFLYTKSVDVVIGGNLTDASTLSPTTLAPTGASNATDALTLSPSTLAPTNVVDNTDDLTLSPTTNGPSEEPSTVSPLKTETAPPVVMQEDPDAQENPENNPQPADEITEPATSDEQTEEESSLSTPSTMSFIPLSSSQLLLATAIFLGTVVLLCCCVNTCFLACWLWKKGKNTECEEGLPVNYAGKSMEPCYAYPPSSHLDYRYA